VSTDIILEPAAGGNWFGLTDSTAIVVGAVAILNASLLATGFEPTTTGAKVAWLAPQAVALAAAGMYALFGSWRQRTADGHHRQEDSGKQQSSGEPPDHPWIVILILLEIVACLVLAPAIGYQRWGNHIDHGGTSVGAALYWSIGNLTTANAPPSTYADIRAIAATQQVIAFLYATFVVSAVINRLTSGN
jgi:hypothetical protein